MNQVLGREVGNALEVRGAIDYLKGDGPREARTHELTLALCARCWCSVGWRLTRRPRA